MGAITGPSIVTSGLVFNADASNINSYNSASIRNHSRNTWYCFASGTAVYALEAGVTLFQRTDAGVITTAVASSTSPQRGTVAVTAGFTYYGDGPIFMNVEDGNHQLAPLSMAGTQFFHNATRFNPLTFYIYAPTAAVVSFYDNPASLGMFGTPTSITSIAAGASTTISTNNLVRYYFKSTAPVVITVQGTGGDRTILSPMDSVIFKRTSGTQTSVNTLGANPTQYLISTFSIWDNVYPVGHNAIGDGAGGDCMQALGLSYLSKTYMYGNTLSDYFILTPYSGTNIVTQYWSGSAWVTWDSHALDGTPTNPGIVIRDGTNGPGVTGTVFSGAAAFMASSANLWRWVGNKPFFLAINDTADDEFAHLGYDYSLTDTIGHLTGLLHNNPTYTDGYINFNGTNTSIGYTGPASGGINVTGQISVECWLYNTNNNVVPFTKGSHYVLVIYSNNTYQWADSSNYSFASFGAARPAAGIGALNVWKHITVTKNASNLISVYVNGSLADSVTFGGALTAVTSNLWLGGYSDTTTAPSTSMLNGRLGQFRIYNTALSAAQVLQNYNATKSRYGL